uniref:Uncharacterized protein n=1 Tax=Arundo donax TaxID=35708 RepID=A0A0A9HKZ4_ARUDO
MTSRPCQYFEKVIFHLHHRLVHLALKKHHHGASRY